MALPPTPAGPPMMGGEGPPPDAPMPMDEGMMPEGEGGETAEENIIVCVTSHSGPDGESYSVYDHKPEDSDGAPGDGAIVTTAEPAEALAAVFKILKGGAASAGQAEMESGYKGEDE